MTYYGIVYFWAIAHDVLNIKNERIKPVNKMLNYKCVNTPCRK